MEGHFAEVFELRFPDEVVVKEVVGDVEKNFLWKGNECWFWWGGRGLHGWLFLFGNLQSGINVEWLWSLFK